MPRFGPIHRQDVIGYLRQEGGEDPFTRKKHEYRIVWGHGVTFPNTPVPDIRVRLLGTILDQASVSTEEWEKL